MPPTNKEKDQSLRRTDIVYGTYPSLVFKDIIVPDQVCAFELILALVLAARWPAGRLPSVQKVRQKRVRTALSAHKGLQSAFRERHSCLVYYVGGVRPLTVFPSSPRSRLNLEIECKRVTALNPLAVEWAFELTRTNMQTMWDSRVSDGAFVWFLNT